MPLPVGSTVQVSFEYRHFQQRLLNTCHWYIESAGVTPSQELATQEIANYFGDTAALGISNQLLDLIPSTCTLDYVVAQIIHPVRYAYFFKSIGLPGNRGVSTSANFDAVVTKRTATAGRSQVGDFYIPGLDANDMVDGVLTQLFIDEIALKMSWLRDRQTMPISGAVLAPVIFHRATGTVSDITNVLTQTEVRVMTRRTVGRGE